MDTSDAKVQTVWSLVKIPAILTLIVTVIRLVGELQGWNETWFGTGVGGEGPDGKQKLPGMFGIVWLVPIFGAYFGYRIRSHEGGPKLGRSIGLFLAAIVIVVGGFFGLMAAGFITMPDPKGVPEEPQGLGYGLIFMAIGLVVCFVAWWRLAITLLFYGVLARIPVIIVTCIAHAMEWDTHHVKLPAGMPAKEGMEKLTFLLVPQATVWLVFTVTVGGLIGAIASSLVRGAKTDPTTSWER